MFILRQGERDEAPASGGWRGAEKERERVPSRLHTVSAEPDVGLDPTNCEIMT